MLSIICSLGYAREQIGSSVRDGVLRGPRLGFEASSTLRARFCATAYPQSAIRVGRSRTAPDAENLRPVATSVR